jgi:hypothetical protein
VNLRTYEALFKGSVIPVNWDRARREKWKVKTRIVTDRAALGEYRCVWTRDGLRGDGGQRIPLSEPGLVGLVGRDWRIKILRQAADYEALDQRIVDIYPTLAGVLLDANHRAAAIMIGAFDFAVYVCTLDPGVDAALWTPADWA